MDRGKYLWRLYDIFKIIFIGFCCFCYGYNYALTRTLDKRVEIYSELKRSNDAYNILKIKYLECMTNRDIPDYGKGDIKNINY